MATDQRMASAKRPRTMLQGPYGHPIHPMLIPIPIGTWVAALIFDIVAVTATEGTAFAVGAYWLIGIGIVGALTAMIFGFLDWSRIPRHTAARRTGIIHMALNIGVTALFVVNFFMRRAGGAEYGVTASMITLDVVALGMLAVSGWLGGKLSYHFGVRVAEEDEQMHGYEQTERRAA